MLQGQDDNVHDRIDVLSHSMVPEPQDAETFTPQHRVAQGVVVARSVFGVLAAVQLDHDAPT
jgi:hypothetical protein